MNCITCKFNKSGLVLNEHEWRNANALVLKRIKSTLNADGYWNGDYGNWDAIVAVCNLETMITFGVSLDESWEVTNNGITYDVNLKKVIEYLRSKIVKKGSDYFFGEDSWDLFRLVLVIKKLKLEKEFPEYKNLEKYCLRLCEDDHLFDLHDKWTGPAVLALGMELCTLLRKTKQKNTLLQSLLSMRNADGSWGDSSNDGLCIWHTSQVLNVITLDSSEEKRSIDCIIQHMQNDSFQREYYLKDYYTSYALWAMHNKGYVDNKSFLDALRDIKERLEAEQIQDRGGLSMIGTVLSRLFTESGKLIDIMIREGELTDYIEENKRLKSEVEELKKKVEKYSDGGVYIRKRTVKILGWLIGVILAAVITTLITLWVTKWVG